VSVLLAALVVVTFALTVAWLDLPARAREVGARSLEGFDALRDPELDDRAKEEALRRVALRLFGLLGLLVGGSALALGLPMLGVWLLELGGVASLEAVLAMLERPDFLAAATGGGLLVFLVGRKAAGS
jgi:hypothetical protein